MREVAHFGHEPADGLLIDAGVFAGPVIFIAQAPEDDGRMVDMLVDQVGQHAFGVLLESRVAHPGAAPGSFLPHHQAELVAEIEDEAVLLVVREADEVRSHLANHREFLAHEVIGHRCGSSGVVCMARGAAEEYAGAVELERAVFDELKAADAEAFFYGRCACGARKCDAAAVEVRRVGGPEARLCDGEGGEIKEAGGWCVGFRRGKKDAAVRS